MSAAGASTPAGGAPATVPVGPFRLVDLDRHQLAAAIVELAATQNGSRPTAAFACHVGGLNARREAEFVTAMQQADLVYADGISVVSLMKLAGAKHVQRHPTTDLGWDVFRVLAERLGRQARVALVGGREGLAKRAGDVIAEQAPVEVILTEHGYHKDWTPVLERLNAAGPDLVVVGLGMPTEAMWTIRNLGELPPALVLTAGGWFGYIVGEEKRAPAWMRKAGLEWMARIAQAPGRLWKRYATGALTTVAMMPGAYRSRRK
jgi:N-acetylglucosaminyldiphosphoundecaprenol N-acetyl-beta-D-mannosaminyltransferase